MNLEADQPVSVSGPLPGCGVGVSLSSYPSSYLISLIIAKPKVLFGGSGQIHECTNMKAIQSIKSLA